VLERGVALCLTRYAASSVCVFCTLYVLRCVCFRSHKCECLPLRPLFRMFQRISFSFLCLHLSSGGGGDGYSGPIKKTKNQGKGNWKWKNSEMEQGDHGLVNRLISHLRIYFRYLLRVERGMRFMPCIFRVMSDSACVNNASCGIPSLIHILLCTVSFTKYEDVSVFVFFKRRPGMYKFGT